MIDPTLITSIDPPRGGEHLNVMISPCGTKIWICIDGCAVFRYRHLSEITIDDQRELPLAAETSVVGVDQHQRDVPAVEIPHVDIEMVEDEHRGRKSKLGIPHKSGTKEYARAYYRRNREKMNERTKKWQQENKDRVQATQQSYRAATKEELHEASVLKSPRQRFEDVFGDNNDTDTNE